MTLGNSLVETASYNHRLQPTQIQAGSLLTLGYGYSGSQNNGNLLSQTITRGAQTWTQNYSYTDGFNRLTAASESGSGTWSENYGFDVFGNRWVTRTGSLPGFTSETPRDSTWYTAKNRINGWTYDNAGSVQSVSNMSRSFTYDAEGLRYYSPV